MTKFIHNIFQGLAVLGAVSFGLAALVTVVDILLRIKGVGLPGVVDYVQLFIIAGAFLAMPYTFLEQGHVRVELLLEMLSKPVRKILAFVVCLLVLGIVVALTIYNFAGLERVIEGNDISQNLGLPMAYFWGPVVLGLGLSIVAVVVLLFEILTGKKV